MSLYFPGAFQFLLLGSKPVTKMWLVTAPTTFFNCPFFVALISESENSKILAQIMLSDPK